MKPLPIFLMWACLASLEAQAIPITYTASLSGASESPPVSSPGSGFTTVVYDPDLNQLTVDVSFTGLNGTVTVAHIHCCTGLPLTGNAGVATAVPSFPGFPGGGTSGTYTHIFDLMDPSSFNPAFVTSSGGTAAGAEAALAAGLAAHTAYLNIHTSFAGSGEIRGFLQAVPELDATSGPAALALLGGVLALARERRSSRYEPDRP